MRLIIDMNLSPVTAIFLRKHGHDAWHLLERQMHRLSDEEIVELAQAESRCIITEDLDFGRILSLQRLRHPSVVIIRLGNTTNEIINAALAPVLEDNADALIAGAILVIEPDGVRVRSLPVW